MSHTIKKTCRACGSSNLIKFLDLGKMPPANSFLKKKDLKNPELNFPLRVYFCEKCTLVQLRDVVPPQFLYTNYDYMSSASQPLADYLLDFGRYLAKSFVQSRNDLVIDIGGNDGTLLSAIKNKCRVLNIEPALKIAKLSRARGVPVLNNFFSEEVANNIVKKQGHAAVVTANNVVAHIDDLGSLFRGVSSLIGDKGVFVFDVHWVGNLVGEGGFDQIYHEHLCYFSLKAIKSLIEKQNLKVFDVQLTNMHGASLRLFVSKNRAVSKNVTRILKEERRRKLEKLSTYVAFAKKTYQNRKEFFATLVQLNKNNKRIIGYGAPAKGNTLFNFCKINSQLIDFIIDTTPFKQGLYAPGSKIPVLHPDKFKNNKVDYAILLAWNYADAIIKKEDWFRKSGGKFIIPVPKVQII